MSHDIFISHSSIDKTIADSVCAGLENAGLRCWVAPRDIRAGDSWGSSIIDAIATSKIMVIVFSSNSNASKQVMREVERAVQKDVVVVPFRIDEVQPSKDMEYFLSATHWLDAITPNMEKHIDNLVTTVKSILSGGEKAPPAPAQPSAVTRSDNIKSSNKRKFPMLGIGIGALICLIALVWLLLPGGEPDSHQASASNTTKAIPVLATQGDIRLKAPSSGVAASPIAVTWSGKSSPKDSILISKFDANDASSIKRVTTGQGSSIEIDLPDQPGNYEVRYLNAATRKVIARTSLEITLPDVQLTIAGTIAAGSEINVQWLAPNNTGDMLTIAEVGTTGSSYVNYAYTKKGSPTSIRIPDKQGKYELRYISSQSSAIWASEPVDVAAVTASVSADVQVSVGKNLVVKWTGPANKRDYLTVAEPGSEGNEYLGYTYVKRNKKANLIMPELAGEYEIRYISGQTHHIWAMQAIKILAAATSVSAPQTTVAGGSIQVEWTGPANKRDHISIAEPGSQGKNYLQYSYVKNKNPIKLKMPEIAGEYEIRYISAVKNNIWAKQAISVTQPEVSVAVVDKAAPGSEISVDWVGPAYKSDYITIGKADSDVKDHISYTYVKPGAKIKLKLPEEAGDYVVRYVSANKRLIWAEALIKAE